MTAAGMTLALPLRITVNGRDHDVEAVPGTALLYVLRNDLCLNGPKYGCGLGECGACAVLVGGQDGRAPRAVRACTTPVSAVAGRPVTTLEGLGTVAAPHPVQAAFVAENAAQCGYCLNGMIIATVALLARDPDPGEAEIRQALRHHLCRCGTHLEILAAVRRAAGSARSGELPRPEPRA
jgi:nicotinate dehydrogenase subunit A